MHSIQRDHRHGILPHFVATILLHEHNVRAQKGELMLGPIDYVVLGFDGNNFDGSIMNELSNATSNLIIRVLDLVFIIKDENGNITEGEYEDQSMDLRETFGDFTYNADMPLLTEHDIAKIGEQLPPNTSAAVLIIEHLWARNLKRAIASAKGFVIADGRIHPEKVEAAAQELETTKA